MWTDAGGHMVAEEGLGLGVSGEGEVYRNVYMQLISLNSSPWRKQICSPTHYTGF